MTLQSLADAKAQARALRDKLAAEGTPISHSKALELVARQNGARDWNTLHARLSREAPQPFHVEQRIQGLYLGQRFAGRIVALSRAGTNFVVSIRFDQPVDSVRFESFANMRRQIRATVGPDGRSPSTTSDGRPHLIIEPPAHVK